MRCTTAVYEELALLTNLLDRRRPGRVAGYNWSAARESEGVKAFDATGFTAEEGAAVLDGFTVVVTKSTVPVGTRR